MRCRTALLAFMLALCLPASTAQAGAWVVEPGHGYLKLWSKWLWGHGYHDGAGQTQAYGNYHELYLATYGEAGLIDRLALTWSMDLVRSAHLQDPVAQQSDWHVSPGDPQVGLRVALLRADRLVMSAELGVLAPLAPSGGLQDFVYEDGTVGGRLRLGAGVWELSGVYAVGYGFDHLYLQAAGGYVFRSDGYDDLVRFSVEVGGDIGSLGLRGRLTGNLPLDTGSAGYGESPSGIGNGVSYVGFAVEADYELVTRWRLGLVLEGGLAAVKRQTGGPVVSLFGSYQW